MPDHIQITRTEIRLPVNSPLARQVVQTALSASDSTDPSEFDFGDLPDPSPLLPPSRPLAALPPAHATYDIPAQSLPPTGPGGQQSSASTWAAAPAPSKDPSLPWWHGLRQPLALPSVRLPPLSPDMFWLVLLFVLGVGALGGMAWLVTQPVIVQEADQVPDTKEQPEPEPQSSLFDPANPPTGVMTAPDGTSAPDGVLATLPPPPVPAVAGNPLLIQEANQVSDPESQPSLPNPDQLIAGAMATADGAPASAAVPGLRFFQNASLLFM